MLPSVKFFPFDEEDMRKNKVRYFREAIPLSIAELARRAGLAPQTITKMEKGLATRKNSELKVAKALQKKYEEVFLSDRER
jgi:DNA-binding XRE family transcriptional regulator